MVCSAATAVIGRVSVFCDTGANASVNPGRTSASNEVFRFYLISTYIEENSPPCRITGAIKQYDGFDAGTTAFDVAPLLRAHFCYHKQSSRV